MESQWWKLAQLRGMEAVETPSQQLILPANFSVNVVQQHFADTVTPCSALVLHSRRLKACDGASVKYTCLNLLAL